MRPQFPIGQLTGHQFDRLVRQEKVLFAKHAARLGSQVAPLRVDQPIQANLPQPQKEGDFALPEILRQPPGGVQQCLLHHIGRVAAIGQ